MFSTIIIIIFILIIGYLLYKNCASKKDGYSIIGNSCWKDMGGGVVKYPINCGIISPNVKHQLEANPDCDCDVNKPMEIPFTCTSEAPEVKFNTRIKTPIVGTGMGSADSFYISVDDSTWKTWGTDHKADWGDATNESPSFTNISAGDHTLKLKVREYIEFKPMDTVFVKGGDKCSFGTGFPCLTDENCGSNNYCSGNDNRCYERCFDTATLLGKDFERINTYWCDYDNDDKGCSDEEKCDLGQGHCDDDNECANGLKCFKHTPRYTMETRIEGGCGWEPYIDAWSTDDGYVSSGTIEECAQACLGKSDCTMVQNSTGSNSKSKCYYSIHHERPNWDGGGNLGGGGWQCRHKIDYNKGSRTKQVSHENGYGYCIRSDDTQTEVSSGTWEEDGSLANTYDVIDLPTTEEIAQQTKVPSQDELWADVDASWYVPCNDGTLWFVRTHYPSNSTYMEKAASIQPYIDPTITTTITEGKTFVDTCLLGGAALQLPAGKTAVHFVFLDGSKDIQGRTRQANLGNSGEHHRWDPWKAAGFPDTDSTENHYTIALYIGRANVPQNSSQADITTTPPITSTTNLAFGKPAKMITTRANGSPLNAVNGIKTQDSNTWEGICIHTAPLGGDYGKARQSGGERMWWRVDLQKSYKINKVLVYLRNCCNNDRHTKCPIGFEKKNDSCIKNITSPKTWEEALEECKAEGDNLVSSDGNSFCTDENHPNLEPNDGINHGTVCRATNSGLWSCPTNCTKTANGVEPYCVDNENPDLPCRTGVNLCPPGGQPNLEAWPERNNHGTLCRASGGNRAHSCPTNCVRTADDVAPYCVDSANPSNPCRTGSSAEWAEETSCTTPSLARDRYLYVSIGDSTDIDDMTKCETPATVITEGGGGSWESPHNGDILEFKCDIIGQYVAVYNETGDHLNFCEVEVFGEEITPTSSSSSSVSDTASGDDVTGDDVTGDDVTGDEDTDLPQAGEGDQTAAAATPTTVLGQFFTDIKNKLTCSSCECEKINVNDRPEVMCKENEWNNQNCCEILTKCKNEDGLMEDQAPIEEGGQFISDRTCKTNPAAEYPPIDSDYAAGTFQCNDNQYMDNGECRPLTICKIDENGALLEYQSEIHTTTSDRKCETITPCDDTEYQSVAPTATTDRECKNITECDDTTEYETKAPTATTDRECSAKKEDKIGLKNYNFIILKDPESVCGDEHPQIEEEKYCKKTGDNVESGDYTGKIYGCSIDDNGKIFWNNSNIGDAKKDRKLRSNYPICYKDNTIQKQIDDGILCNKLSDNNSQGLDNEPTILKNIRTFFTKETFSNLKEGNTNMDASLQPAEEKDTEVDLLQCPAHEINDLKCPANYSKYDDKILVNIDLPNKIQSFETIQATNCSDICSNNEYCKYYSWEPIEGENEERKCSLYGDNIDFNLIKFSGDEDFDFKKAKIFCEKDSTVGSTTVGTNLIDDTKKTTELEEALKSYKTDDKKKTQKKEEDDVQSQWSRTTRSYKPHVLDTYEEEEKEKKEQIADFHFSTPSNFVLSPAWMGTGFGPV